MADETNVQLWSNLAGWIIMVFCGGVGFGHLKHQSNSHQKAIDNCNVGSLMTEVKCKEFHHTHQAATNIKLDTIQSTLDELKVDRRKVDQRLGQLASKIDVMYDRWEQRHEKADIVR